jgi:hypothetical protein
VVLLEPVIDIDAVGVPGIVDISNTWRHVGMGQIEELPGLAHWQHAQQCRIHHAEDRRVGANAKGQRCNYRKGKAGGILHLPYGVAKIPEHGFHLCKALGSRVRGCNPNKKQKCKCNKTKKKSQCPFYSQWVGFAGE